MKYKKRILVVSLVFIAYFLNFVWESFHAVFLYQNIASMSAKSYLFLMAYASSMDSFLILLMYSITALIFRDLFWMLKIKRENILLFCSLGVLIAIWIEYKAVFIFHEWAYTSLMPTIFGLGLSPLIQLAITGVITVLFTARIVSKK